VGCELQNINVFSSFLKELTRWVTAGHLPPAKLSSLKIPWPSSKSQIDNCPVIQQFHF
jgi:hypothetical protein